MVGAALGRAAALEAGRAELERQLAELAEQAAAWQSKEDSVAAFLDAMPGLLPAAAATGDAAADATAGGDGGGGGSSAVDRLVFAASTMQETLLGARAELAAAASEAEQLRAQAAKDEVDAAEFTDMLLDWFLLENRHVRILG